ncbi:MAG: PD-(D/E)XK nuclease family protein, partial [Prevotellaceae bacterium]|nr:PD-(D/E)XK nuclease family protein [Prevotellaceae bacterium]
IDTTRGYGFREKQIYVVYLPPVYDKDPDMQSWGKYFDSEIFSERYLKLSFRDDILPWLKDCVLPDVKIKDVYMRSAVEQYIDHLEGIFELRKINKITNMELQKFIKKELGLNGNPQGNIAILTAKQEELNKLDNQLQLLKDSAEREIFLEWQTFLSKNYSGYEPVAEEVRAGLIMPADSTTVRVSVSIDGDQLYCQIDMSHLDVEEKILPESVREKAGDLLPKKNKYGEIWKYFPRYAYTEVFNRLKEVIEVLKQ